MINKKTSVKFNIFFKIILIIIFIFGIAMGQDRFIKASGSNFTLEGKEFKFHGLNASYLFQQAAYGNLAMVDSVLDDLVQLKVKVIRMPAHSEGETYNDKSIVRKAPYEFNFKTLEALDYILEGASKRELKLILILANNWGHYGGIPTYLKWRGLEEHDRFYTDDSIKTWYKYYLNMIANRKNTITGKIYKNDETIFSWELINEPRSSDKTGKIINQWLTEMSVYLKSIDKNHMVASGEEGFDISDKDYSELDYYYNGKQLLLNGYFGISFIDNLRIQSLDYASIHNYPLGYQFRNNGAINWIRDHSRLCKIINKPLLLGEYSVKDKNVATLKSIFNEIKNCRNVYGMYWQYIPNNYKYDDGYGFNYFQDNYYFNEMCKEILIFNENDDTDSVESDGFKINHSFPNPTNGNMTIGLNMPESGDVYISLYDITGEKKSVKMKNHLIKGYNELRLSFNGFMFNSGVYFLTFNWAGKIRTLKFVILK